MTLGNGSSNSDPHERHDEGSVAKPGGRDPRLEKLKAAKAEALLASHVASSQESPAAIRPGSTIVAHETLDRGLANNEPIKREPPQAEGFQLLEFLGEGSFGVVWKAFDNKLKRIVALKFLHGVNRQNVERFKREAMLAAQLKHPGIVGIHELAGEDDAPFLVCEFVDGALLYDWRSVFDASYQDIAKLFEKLARSIHFAHEHGVVHRDLKPGNVIVDWDEEPHILDFGLAKGSLTEDSLTVDGMLIGTLAYMSPEQTTGKQEQAQAATDIYSIGVMLYGQLVDELPFRGSPKMLVFQIQNKDPLPPRKLDHQIPRDLEVICLKCLEKSPEQRYASASDLAEDLRLFLARMPINSRPTGSLTKAWRWCVRNPALSFFAAAFVTSVVTAIVLSISYAVRAREDANHYQRLAYAVSMKNVQHQVFEGQHYRALELLREFEPLPGERDLRKWEWFYWDQYCRFGMTEEIQGTSAIRAIVESPDGQWLAWGVNDGSVFLKPKNSAARAVAVGRLDRSIQSILWSKNSKSIVIADDGGKIHLWSDLHAELKKTELFDIDMPISRIRFHPDGESLFVASGPNQRSHRRGRIIRIHMASKEIVWENDHIDGQVCWFDVSADAASLAWAQDDLKLSIIDTLNQEVLFTDTERGLPTSCFGFIDELHLAFHSINEAKESSLNVFNIAKPERWKTALSFEKKLFYCMDIRDSRIAIGGELGQTEIIDIFPESKTLRYVKSVPGPLQRVIAASLDGSGNLINGGDDGK